MKTKTLIQDEITIKQIGSLVGRWAISDEVVTLLALPVTGRTGDIWVISNDGFAQMRPMKNNRLHLRFTYGESAAAKNEALLEAIRFAKEMSATAIYINERGDSGLEKFGFVRGKQHKKSQFYRFEKQL